MLPRIGILEANEGVHRGFGVVRWSTRRSSVPASPEMRVSPRHPAVARRAIHDRVV